MGRGNDRNGACGDEEDEEGRGGGGTGQGGGEESNLDGEMRRMPMSVLGDERKESKKISQAMNGLLTNQKRSGGAMIVLVSAVFVIFFLLTYMTSNSSNHFSSLTANVVERPEDLRDLLRVATEKGIQAGSLIPIRKSDTEVVTHSSLPFMVSYMKEARLRSRVKPTNPIDPFAQETMDMSLFVSYVPPMHTLVLNKFPSFPDHAILTTNRFIEQGTPLTIEDLDAWYWALSQLDAFGFYNSDPLSGSSQPHKHVQLIPRRSLNRKFVSNSGDEVSIFDTSTSFDLPVETLLNPHVRPPSSNSWSPFNPLDPANGIHTIEQYHFRHAVIVLFTEEEWLLSQKDPVRRPFSDYLYTSYHMLLQSLDLATKDQLHGSAAVPLGVSYNLLLTPRWMMIIPRAHGDYRGMVDVNGLGFYGMLLFRNESTLSALRHTGLMAALEGVAVRV